MDIDLVALRQLERDKELKLDVLLRALEAPAEHAALL